MTIERLDNCLSAQGEIESLQERIERVRATRERMAKPSIGMQGNTEPTKERLEETENRLMELEETLSCRLVEREKEIEEVEAWIRTLPRQQRQVIRLRYVDGMAWRQVAYRTHYSTDGVKRINTTVKRKLRQAGKGGSF